MIITPREVFDRVLAMEENVNAMRGLLEQTIALQKQRDDSVETRLENHGTRLGNHDTDISSLNSRVTRLEELEQQRQGRRTPWWVWLTAAGTVVTGVGGTLSLFFALSTLSEAYQQYAP